MNRDTMGEFGLGAQGAADLVRQHRQALDRHGDSQRWRTALDRLPCPARGWQVADGRIEAGAAATEPEVLRELLATFIPWRKGPLRLGGVAIETEWRSDWKWDRLADRIDLTGRRVLDVGAGNGYFGWRMLAAGASRVLGCDPTVLFVMQHEVISHFAGPSENHLLALPLEALPADLDPFDTVFSLGVLYHRRDHRAHLDDLARHLAPGGELVLETLVLPDSDHAVLKPPGRYANMRNVHAVPSLATLTDWLAAAGYGDIECIDQTPTGPNEQRTTAWMPFHSLSEALDPKDPSLTREGHPAPLRATLLARR